MPQTPPRGHAPAWLVPTIVTIDTLLILFPPLHWWFASGSLSLALGYVIGVPVVITISLVILDRAVSHGENAPAQTNHKGGHDA